MKKNKIVKISVFSILFGIAVVVFITMMVFSASTPHLSVLNAEIVSTTNNVSDSCQVELEITLKNRSPLGIENSRVDYTIYHASTHSTLFYSRSYSNSHPGIIESEFSPYEEKIENRTININLAYYGWTELNPEDLEIVANVASVEKMLPTNFLASGLAMVPFAITFGGFLLYCIFEKTEDEKQI